MFVKMIAFAALFAAGTACASLAATAGNDNAGSSRMSSRNLGQSSAGAAYSLTHNHSHEVGHGKSVGPASPHPNAGVPLGYADAAGKGSGPTNHR